MNEAKTNEDSKKLDADKTAPKNGQTQYKATKIWYEIINSFRESVPLKKHWRNFRTYPDCFSASEAVEWLFRYLKSSPNFKSHTTLTRQQAIQLLQIFLKEKIIEDVRAGDLKFTFKEFHDDDRLYKFCVNNRFYKNATKSSDQSLNKTAEKSDKSLNKTPENKSDNSESIQNESKNIAEIKKTKKTDEKINEIKDDLNVLKPIIPNKENIEPNIKTLKVLTPKNLRSFNNGSKENFENNNRKSDYKIETSSKLFKSKLADSTNKSAIAFNIHRASSLKRKPTTRSIHYHNGKLIPIKLSKNEEEVWSRVAQKLLESIVKKSLCQINNINLSSSNRNNEFMTRQSSTTSILSIHGSTNQKILFDDFFDAGKVISGANIHHNCTHVNKHGVVTETENDFQPWLVKAMTCLMTWKEEPDEFPGFLDVFAEINIHFNDLNEPLITTEIGSLFRKIMILLLIPEKNTLQNSQNSESGYFNTSSVQCINSINSSSSAIQNESNKKNFDNLMNNLKSQLLTNNKDSISSDSLSMNTPASNTINKLNNGYNPKSYKRLFNEEDLELQLIENAKLPSIPIIEDNKMILNTNEQKQQLIQDIFLASVVKLEECCEDCLDKYNDLNHFISHNAVEFNEFVSSLNYLDDSCQNVKNPEIDSIIDPCEFNKHLKRFDDEECNDLEAALKLKESQERFANLKLKFSPIKSDNYKQMSTSVNCGSNYACKTLPKCLSEKRLNRNNSFRTAMGEIETENGQKSSEAKNDEKNESSVQKSTRVLKRSAETESYNSNKSDDDSHFKKPCDPDDTQSQSFISKSFSMNSIQGILNNQKSEISSAQYNSLDASKKRRLYQNSMDSLNEKTSNESEISGTSTIPLTSSTLNRNLSLNQYNTNDNNKHVLRPMKSHGDLCCQGGFVNRNLNKYFSASMNLETISNGSSSNNTKNESDKALKLSNKSLNTLGGLLKNTALPLPVKPDLLQERRAFFNRIFSLSNEIESEILCFMIKAFRILALMLPPSKKRKLHLLLRFLYKLRCDQNACKYLIELNTPKSAKKQNSMESIIEDVQYIDESLNTFSSDTSMASFTQKSARVANNTREHDTKSKASEKIIIKSFFKSIISSKKPDIQRQKYHEGVNLHGTEGVELSKDEEDQLSMKLVQILINHYPEIMRIPEELIINVDKQKLSASRSSGNLQHLSTFTDGQSSTHHHQISTKISLEQYDKQTAELSKQHLTELLNNILTDLHMKDSEKILRLKKFKEKHSDVYEEKYPAIKKALNILGINESFLVPNIHLIQNNSCFGSELNSTHNNRRESDYYSLKKRTALAKLTESAKKRTGLSIGSNCASNNSSQLNQTTIIPSFSSSSSTTSTSSISSAIGVFPKFFNKRKKENLI